MAKVKNEAVNEKVVIRHSPEFMSKHPKMHIGKIELTEKGKIRQAELKQSLELKRAAVKTGLYKTTVKAPASRQLTHSRNVSRMHENSLKNLRHAKPTEPERFITAKQFEKLSHDEQLKLVRKYQSRINSRARRLQEEGLNNAWVDDVLKNKQRISKNMTQSEMYEIYKRQMHLLTSRTNQQTPAQFRKVLEHVQPEMKKLLGYERGSGGVRKGDDELRRIFFATLDKIGGLVHHGSDFNDQWNTLTSVIENFDISDAKQILLNILNNASAGDYTDKLRDDIDSRMGQQRREDFFNSIPKVEFEDLDW